MFYLRAIYKRGKIYLEFDLKTVRNVEVRGFSAHVGAFKAWV